LGIWCFYRGVCFKCILQVILRNSNAVISNK